MKKSLAYILFGAACLLSACASKPKLEISLSDKFEGKDVELINFLDSATIASGTVADGKLTLEPQTDAPVFAALVIDGRTRGFYVTEPGLAVFNDSTQSAAGTPLNNRFATMLASLDSIENLDDMPLYQRFAESCYNENKENPLGSYFGIEWLKHASLQQADSMLASAPEALRNSPKTAYYHRFATLRDATSPGRKFVDFKGETADGKPVDFSEFVKKGKFTLVDFWASWCPYCIKELPELAAFYEEMKPLGVEIVGVAVRDTPDDSKAAVKKHNISWPVVYNTQRRPYDIYGFSGIPHHILIGPDGTILSRGESAAQIKNRIHDLIKSDSAVVISE